MQFDIGMKEKEDPMARPHIRFNGTSMSENSGEFWNHKQNDALGYFAWLASCMMSEGNIPIAVTPEEMDSKTITDVVWKIFEYLERIEYWHDADNGHWEEACKVEASSIGPVVAAVRLFRKFLDTEKTNADRLKLLLNLETKGLEALTAILPNESIQPGNERDVDGAQLFLIYPLNVVDDPNLVDSILARVETKLCGQIGCRRYNGDSYWCREYKDKTGDDATKAYTDEEMKERDKFVKAGKGT
eukprot:GHVN01057873.1.p1 GENE.GHVN01057873.1~~GHVN01057873.1.p1  ORF type:complete len:244 (+),score=34.08 GHVN01057873.1:205-936(+)